MNKDFDFHKTTMPESRKADYYLCCLDSSVFIDFNSSPNNKISLIRISFDGFGCCNIDNKSKKLNLKDSQKFIEEIDKEELLEKTKDKLEIITDDIEKAVTVLEEKFDIKSFKVIDKNTIYVYEKIDQSGEINKALVRADIKVDSLSINRESLEEYFINLTGGGKHV